jgi:hypothetical protein
MRRRQRDRGPDLFTLRCQKCGRYLVQTEGGFLACPNGHGRLQLDQGTIAAPVEEPDPCDLWERSEYPGD